jgi:opacity protein-like surface antigen
MRQTAWMPLAAIATSLALAFLPASARAADATPAAPTTPATTTPANRAIEGVTSTIFQQKQSSFSGIGLRMRIQVPQLIPGFTVMPAVEYWHNKTDLSEFGIETHRKDATLAALARYEFPHPGWQPYVGAGLAIHFLSAQVNAPSLGLNDRSESLTKGGLVFLGGAKFGLAGKLGNMIELEYHYVTEHEQLKFNWGLSYEF